jgi:two-component system OmpR family sensor kinase
VTDVDHDTVAGQERGRWWDRRTLRFRVVASLIAVMMAAFAVIGVVTVIALNRFLIGRVDQQISDAGTRYVASEAGDTRSAGSTGDGDQDFDDGFGDARGQAIGTLGARVVAGRVIGFGIVGKTVPPQLPTTGQQLLSTLPVGNARSVDLGAFGDYRLRAFGVGGGNKVIVGLPLRPVRETLGELLLVELIVFGVVLIATVAGSRWLVGLSLRPLARVTATAREVAGTPLSEDEVVLATRVPFPESATEVGQLGDAFNHMLDHVEASLVTRRDTEARLRRFIADASHELRTPVAAIRGHAESVKHAPEEIPASVAQAMQRIESEAVRMGVLVDDLLLLARLDAGRALDKLPVDLTRLAIDATNDARVAGPDHRWQLNLPDVPISVTGDPHRLHELITNLLTNARVHTPPGTTIELALACDDVGDRAVLSVVDNGPGIPAAAQPRVFERFYRADPVRAPMTGSSGLGLAIVAAVAAAHDGTVGLRSEPGRTEFEVRLPLSAVGSEPLPSGQPG